MMTDPIADMFTRIRNALLIGRDRVEIPNSKMKARIAEILQEEGFVKGFKTFKDDKQGTLKVFLKYHGEEPVIRGIRKISKPGRRAYVKADKIPKVLNGLGIAIVSTSAGLMTDEGCREKGIGGEVVGHIW